MLITLYFHGSVVDEKKRRDLPMILDFHVLRTSIQSIFADDCIFLLVIHNI